MPDWMKKVKMICPKCKQKMEYTGDYYGQGTFLCKCGLEIHTNEGFTTATVERDVEPFYIPTEGA